MLLWFEAERVGESLCSVRRRLEDSLDDEHAAYAVAIERFLQGAGQLGRLWCEPKSAGIRCHLGNQAAGSKLAQTAFYRGGIAPNHVKDLLGRPFSHWLALQDLKNFELLDALDVISKEVSYSRWKRIVRQCSGIEVSGPVQALGVAEREGAISLPGFQALKTWRGGSAGHDEAVEFRPDHRCQPSATFATRTVGKRRWTPAAWIAFREDTQNPNNQMKHLTSLNVIAAIALGLSTGSFAADMKPKKEAPASGTVSAADPKKAPDAPSAAPAAPAAPAKPRPLPMNSRADSIDHTNKTFTMKRKDGVEVKHVLSATAEIKNGDSPATFADIKKGDWVAGSRFKHSETEYEVVKITKFGPRVKKEDKKE